MSNSFTSLEKVQIFLGDLINSKEDAIPLKFISKLINDLTNLLKDESEFYDVEIKVGIDENDVKIFRAHSTILKSRSPYFKIALSNNWIKRSEEGIILFEKKNISPKVFEVLLTYIYNGIINIDNLDIIDIIELLEACDELDFNELIDDLQSYIILKEKKWIQQNLIYIHEISSKHQSFNLLQEFFKELISENPELFLKTEDFNIINKSMLKTLLVRDDLIIDEIYIWNRDLLKDVILLIRFNQISPSDFYNKIKPYESVIDKQVFNDLCQCYFSNEWQSKSILQKSPRIGKGKLLSLQMKASISNWIDEKQYLLYNEDNLPYKFKLILSGTQNGFSRSVFEEKCYNAEQTVAIMKFKETDELVGGYNPVGWHIKGKSQHQEYSIQTDKSFIFKIDENCSIISRVIDSNSAIFHTTKNIHITSNKITFHEKLIDFSDLELRVSLNSKPYCFYSYRWNSYENNLNLRNSNKKLHLVEEFEVYKLIKKN